MNKTQRVRIETPIGTVESDSGSHMIDFLSVAIIIVLMFIGKKLIDKWI